jgi:hypothetical protein
MARFTTAGGSGTPGPQGPQGLKGDQGDQGFQGDPGLRFMGQWDDIRTFVINDVVTINGESFVSILGSTAVSPYDTEYWNKLAAKGNDANTADFTFEASTMSTNEDMDINVLGVPGVITLSAYAGVNVQTHEDFGLTTNKIITSNNGAIDNVKIGDDAYIGDGNIANAVVIKGQQTATNGGVVFGSAKTEKISTDGSNLSLDASNDIILNPGSTYAYIGTPTVNGSTRIAKWSDTLIRVSSVPAHDYGVAGDRKGMFAHDNTHLYICIADYVNNSTVIWKRINWAGGSW